jgi:hypothetical protein
MTSKFLDLGVERPMSNCKSSPIAALSAGSRMISSIAGLVGRPGRIRSCTFPIEKCPLKCRGNLRTFPRNLELETFATVSWHPLYAPVSGFRLFGASKVDITSRAGDVYDAYAESRPAMQSPTRSALAIINRRGGIHGADRRNEARICHVQIINPMRLAVEVEDGLFGIGSEP